MFNRNGYVIDIIVAIVQGKTVYGHVHSKLLPAKVFCNPGTDGHVRIYIYIIIIIIIIIIYMERSMRF